MKPDTIKSKETPKNRSKCRPSIKHLIGVAGAVLVMGLVFRLLWNWVGVPYFMFPHLTYLQAVSAVTTASILMMLCRWAFRCHRRRIPFHKTFACRPRKPSGPDKEDGIRDILYRAMLS